MPPIMPIAAGSQLRLSKCSDSSSDGIISDHTDAATITPAAKPSRALCRREDTLLRTNSTVDAPSAVPKNGIAMIANVFMPLYISKSSPTRYVLGYFGFYFY